MPATGDWADPANWDPAGVPTSADDAYIDNGGTATVASSAAAYYVYLGDENTGTVIQTGGTHDIAERFYMAWEGDSAGVYGL